MKTVCTILKLSLFFILLFYACSPKSASGDTTDPPIDTTPMGESLKNINTNIAIGSPIEVIFNNDTYLNIIKTELSTGEALWHARWGGWLAPNKYDFKELNKNVNWMIENKITPSVNMLVGSDFFMPDWLIKSKSQTPESLEVLLYNLVDTIMNVNDNKAKVETWNVINELFDDDGTYRTPMLWSKMGWEQDSSDLNGDDKINESHPIFIRKAFEYCRQKTDKKLELRDFNIENPLPGGDNFSHKKSIAIYQLVKHMLNTNIPIDALGIQGHLQMGKHSWRTDSNALKKTVEKFKALGLEVYITELDISIEDEKWTQTVAVKQKDMYYEYVRQAIEGGVKRISLWGIQDGMDKGWLTDKYPLLWTEDFKKKPAYFGCQQALMDTKK
jgi:GH35 family endo-1,4-beta-xylanase